VSNWTLCDGSPVIVEMIKEWDQSTEDLLMRAAMLAAGIQLVRSTMNIGVQAMHFIWHHATRQVPIFLGPTKAFRHGLILWMTLVGTTHEISTGKPPRRLCVICHVTSAGSLCPTIHRGQSGCRPLINSGGMVSIGLDFLKPFSPYWGPSTCAADVMYYLIMQYTCYVSDMAFIFYWGMPHAVAFGNGYVEQPIL
jgi:hypothetical protein